MSTKSRTAIWVLSLLALSFTVSLYAFVQPNKSSTVAQKEVLHPDLEIDNAYLPLNEVAANVAAQGYRDLDRFGIPSDHARIDPRSGRWGTLLLAEPLLPGSGVGNTLSWNALRRGAPQDDQQLAEAAWDAFYGFLMASRAELRIDPSELSAKHRVVVHDGGNLVQIYAPRAIDGVPIRGSYLVATINRGNLVLFGAENWGDVNISTQPGSSARQATEAFDEFVKPLRASANREEPELLLVPMALGENPKQVEIGQGLYFRLVWALSPEFDGEFGQWEALVDAASGEVLAFQDTAHYAANPNREVKGGVFPVTNDGVPPDGVEQPMWPMPFDEVTTGGGIVTTDSGGNMPTGVVGNATSMLDGLFIRMNDNCGPISLTTGGDIDFGTSGGTDCVTPGFGGAGNTHASRSGFYELNRIKELARGQLPANLWLQAELLANMNIPSICNAFWNGTVNFFRSGGPCSNTGEIAAVFDHEWGHGMDNNDANGFISNPGEGIADLYAALRLNTSCIGRNFIPGTNCTGYGDPCTSCTGIRDIDWANRVSGVPHDVAWAIANCSSVHCRGAVYSEAVWDLYTRDLQGPPYNMDSNTALEVTMRLTFQGSGLVGLWFQNLVPFGGCGANSGYLNYLAADDDNGNLADGTPHMGAIFAAFDRHGAACGAPAVVDSGCAVTPVSPPIVTVTPGDKSATLTWTSVMAATEYEIFRTDGVFGCDFGKVKVGNTNGLTFTDTGLQNGREYYYVVIPKGPSDSCFGPASSCTPVTPDDCCGVPLTDTEFFLGAPSNQSVSDSRYAYCAMALDKHDTGSYCFANHNAGTSNWDFSAVGSAASCGFVCIDQGANCPCGPYFEEFFLTNTSNKILNGTDYAYCAIGGAKHLPNTGYCWADFNPGTNTWNLSSLNASCNFVCIPEASTCSNFAFDEFFLSGPSSQTLRDTNYSYCAISGDKHAPNSYCYVDHNTGAGTWVLRAVGNAASCNFECIQH